MPRAIDPEQDRVARLLMRAAALERHARARDPATGKSRIAVAAGRAGGQRTAERYASSSAWGLRMAMKRHFGVPLPDQLRNANATGGRSVATQKGADDATVDVSS